MDSISVSFYFKASNGKNMLHAIVSCSRVNDTEKALKTTFFLLVCVSTYQ